MAWWDDVISWLRGIYDGLAGGFDSVRQQLDALKDQIGGAMGGNGLPWDNTGGGGLFGGLIQGIIQLVMIVAIIGILLLVGFFALKYFIHHMETKEMREDRKEQQKQTMDMTKELLKTQMAMGQQVVGGSQPQVAGGSQPQGGSQGVDVAKLAAVAGAI